MFYIGVHGGLNNKLLPLLSLLRISNKDNHKVKCFWGPNTYTERLSIHFKDLFENIKNISFISQDEYANTFYKKIKIYNPQASDRDRNEIIYHPDKEDAIFHFIVHPISYESDNIINKFVPYAKVKTDQTQFIKELRMEVKHLIPVKEIRDKLIQPPDNTLGIHIRTTDGGFTDVKVQYAIECIEKYDGQVYVSCDNIDTEKFLKNKFQEKILLFENPFGEDYSDKFNRTTYSDMNGVCEMYNLARCSQFVGTPGSSFTFMVWLLRNDPVLDFWCDNPWK